MTHLTAKKAPSQRLAHVLVLASLAVLPLAARAQAPAPTPAPVSPPVEAPTAAPAAVAAPVEVAPAPAAPVLAPVAAPAGPVVEAPEAAPEAESDPLVSVRYEDHALHFDSRDGNFSAEMQNRFQFRYAWPFDADPRSHKDLDKETSSFMVRRARFKLQGHAFRPWLAWYFQYDWSQPVMRDFSLEVKKFKWLRVLVGRRKVFFNDERVSSSGKQQFVNRSIVNDLFTVDRQQGIQVFGRLFADTPADLTYYTGVFSGRGVGERLNDDLHMMYTARLQWNVVGGEMEWSQSDVELHQKPTINLAAAAATNIADCTAFETDARSCRELATARSDGSAFGDPAGEDETRAAQYKTDQLVAEGRLKWRGIYAKHEFHMKRVTDRYLASDAPGRETVLRGSLTQLGWLPHGLISAIPEAFEIAARFAHVNPVVGVGNDWQTERTGVINWFFSGHANKLSLEAGYLTVAERGSDTRGQTRVRAQWDVSF